MHPAGGEERRERSSAHQRQPQGCIAGSTEPDATTNGGKTRQQADQSKKEAVEGEFIQGFGDPFHNCLSSVTELSHSAQIETGRKTP
jgi:hypothetical protein